MTLKSFGGPLKAVQKKKFGVRVRCIVCDGTSTNISTLELLGVRIPDSPFFTSVFNEKVYTVLHAAHMIKLARNCFAGDNLINISWRYIENLFKVQQEEGLHLANKLSKAHVEEWSKRKMKVKLATQVLSRSVAHALEFLKNMGHRDFENCDSTVQFILLIYEIFDRVNAHSPFVSGCKQAITRKNIDEVDAFFCSSETSLGQLKNLQGIKIINSRLRTLIITCLRVTISLSNDLFEEHSSDKLWYFIPYRLSQDSIERFFRE